MSSVNETLFGRDASFQNDAVVGHPGLLRKMRDSDPDEDGRVLRERFREEGYILVRGVLDPAAVTRARAEVVEFLRERDGLPDGLSPEDALRKSKHLNHNLPTHGMCGGVRALMAEPRLHNVAAHILDTQVRAFSYAWLRVRLAGGPNTSPPHCDGPYFGFASDKVVTCWVPLQATNPVRSGLAILERSNHAPAIRDEYAKASIFDGDKTKVIGGGFCASARRAHEITGLSWVSADYQPGDVLMFTRSTLHTALDNRSDEHRIAIDFRYLDQAQEEHESWRADPPSFPDLDGYFTE